MERSEAIAQKLSDVSTRVYPIPEETVPWTEAIDPEAWYTSPELISLYGTEVYDALDEPTQKKLAFWEAVNYYSLNINGEKPLVKGMVDRLFQNGRSPEIDRYLQHFIDEENKHMQYFGRFCQQYAGKVYPDKKLNFPKEMIPGEEEFLFFLKIVIFEEISDTFNVYQSRDERLHPVARAINQLHHRDEARHLTFGRQLVKDLFDEYAPEWSDQELARIRQEIVQYTHATWREYYNPQVYVDCGIADNGVAGRRAYDLFQLAYHSERSKEIRRIHSAECLERLVRANILLEIPEC